MPESHSEQLRDNTGVTKATILNRVIAKSIDFLIIAALFEIVPRAGYFAGLGYILIGDGLFEGRSVGKKLIGLKVVLSKGGGKCAFKESIIRNFPFVIGYIIFGVLKSIPLIGWLFSFIVLIIILGLESLIMLGNEKGLRLGDEIAGTMVVEDAADIPGININQGSGTGGQDSVGQKLGTGN
ncbi:MAG: RDD family protein [Nitrospirae bacterium]|nr:RDD family protein [Nitrospirota bacterium]